MAIIKLTNAGDSHTATVVGAEYTKGQYGEQVKFTLEDGDVLYIGADPANRQLGRCGFLSDDDSEVVDLSAVIGNTLTFSRDANAKKGAAPYWGISVASHADAKPKPATKRLTEPKPGPVAAALSAPAKSAPATPLTHSPSSGPYVPGLDDAPPPTDADAPVDFAQELAGAAAEAVDESATRRLKLEAAYDALALRVYVRQLGRYSEKDTAGVVHERVPFDGSSVQAEAATIWIAWDKSGLLRSIA